MDVSREAMTLIVDSPETWPLWPKAPARLPPIRQFSAATISLRDRVFELFLTAAGRRLERRAAAVAESVFCKRT